MRGIIAMAAGILLSVSLVAANAAPTNTVKDPPKGLANAKKTMKTNLDKTKKMQALHKKAAAKRAQAQSAAQ